MTENPQAAKARRRHLRYWRVMRVLARPILRATMAYIPERAPAIESPVLVLANHNTDLDPVLVALSFERHMYFVASEHIFRWGWISRAMRYLFAPIPLIKGRSDIHAAMAIMRQLRGGRSVCIFAEGNRSVDGRTAPISPATGLLAKAGVDLVTYRLEGGYFTHPRWARSMRRGRMAGRMVGHYPAARLKEMTQDEINEIIRRDLYEDAYARQALAPVRYRGRRVAEHLETALYLCPACRQVGRLHSRGNRLACACGLAAVYADTGRLEGVAEAYDTVEKWYAWQLAQTDALIDAAGEGELFTDAGQKLYQVEPCSGATLLAQGTLRMTDRALDVAGRAFPLADISDMAIVGQQTITFSLTDGAHYEIKSDHPRSGYKYLNAFEALRGRALATEKE